MRRMIALVLSAAIAVGTPTSGAIAAETAVRTKDGSRDFDFHNGTWKTHIHRLVHPLAGSSEWTDYDGVSQVIPIWDGKASVFELNASGPAGSIEGAGLRLYDPEARQWSLNWSNSSVGKMDDPLVGEFLNGRGDFFGEQEFKGRTILVRNSFSQITANSSRFEQAFSGDYGRTWETNWIMTFDRMGKH